VRWVRGMFQRLAREGRTVFVSSHMMSEMEHTAERLVVIGKGKLIADETLEEFSRRGSGSSVLVKSPDVKTLHALLSIEGATRAEIDESDGSLTVDGLPAARIGELAYLNNIMLLELATQNASLENAFMELTADSVEYLAGEDR
jgi:ABC-2 type transport system ATP-binding protein